MKYLSILTFLWAQSQGVWKAVMHTPSYKASVRGWVGDSWLRITSDIQTDTSTYQVDLLGKEKQMYVIDHQARVAYEIPPTSIKALSPATVEQTANKKTWQENEIRHYRLRGEGWSAEVWWLEMPFSVKFSNFIHQEILGHAFVSLPSGLPVSITAQDAEGKTLLTWKLESWQREVPKASYSKIPYPVKKFCAIETK